jgi:hypothetical protein
MTTNHKPANADVHKKMRLASNTSTIPYVMGFFYMKSVRPPLVSNQRLVFSAVWTS